MRPLAPLFVSLLLHASGCGISRRCSSGNHTTHHAGKDAYAYDFAMPVGSPVRAMRAGTVLGASGNSGWSTGPHLHVQVQSDCGTWWCPSVPFTFQEGSVATGTSLSSGNCP
jgi:murein DD-endopeptidase MepM/ murein hydrolase activator NlpD